MRSQQNGSFACQVRTASHFGALFVLLGRCLGEDTAAEPDAQVAEGELAAGVENIHSFLYRCWPGIGLINIINLAVKTNPILEFWAATPAKSHRNVQKVPIAANYALGWAKNVQKSWYTKSTLRHTWWDLKGSQKVIRWLSRPILPHAKQAKCQGWARCIWKSHGSHFLARKWKSMWKSHILSNFDFMKKILVTYDFFDFV